MVRYTEYDIKIRDRVANPYRGDPSITARSPWLPRYVASLPIPGAFAYGRTPSEAKHRLLQRRDLFEG